MLFHNDRCVRENSAYREGIKLLRTVLCQVEVEGQGLHRLALECLGRVVRQTIRTRCLGGVDGCHCSASSF